MDSKSKIMKNKDRERWLNIMQTLTDIKYIRGEIFDHFVKYHAIDTEHDVGDWFDELEKLRMLDSRLSKAFALCSTQLGLVITGRFENVEIKTLLDVLESRFENVPDEIKRIR